jgi:hypothetical protein
MYWRIKDFKRLGKFNKELVMLTLHMLLEKLIASNQLTPSRIPPMRTAVKQYAWMLGIDAHRCPPERYHLSDLALTHLINTNAPANLGPDALRNLRNNIRFLLKTAVALQLLPPLEQFDGSWKKRRVLARHWNPMRGEGLPWEAYALHPLPAHLAEEFEAFATWSMSPYTPGRPTRLHKGPNTMARYRQTVMQVAGFLVRERLADPDQLSLRDIVDPHHVTDYLQWMVERRGKVTLTPHLMVVFLGIIARWLQDDAISSALNTLARELPRPEAVRHKERAWVSLAALEAAGIARYPLNAQRFRELKPAAQRILQRAAESSSPPIPARKHNFVRTAAWVGQSLILRLFIRVPMRQRNMCEMTLGHNLVRLPDGQQIRFRGRELKIAWRRGRTSEAVYRFPADLEPLLEEWLNKWRPLLVQTPDEPHVFVNKDGRPFNQKTMWHMVCRMTYKFTDVAVNPHMIRDIWATEYIKATRDIAGAAYMLGNTVEVVLKHYAHLLDADAEARAGQWLSHTIISSQSPSPVGPPRHP